MYSRGGKAVRLTYDHKGSDAQEAKRITDAGGFVMNNRVNGQSPRERSVCDAHILGSRYRRVGCYPIVGRFGDERVCGWLALHYRDDARARRRLPYYRL